jgi:hypothetical protein
LDFPEIAELDINPFIVYERGQGGIAIDMRLILDPIEHTEALVAQAKPLGSTT